MKRYFIILAVFFSIIFSSRLLIAEDIATDQKKSDMENKIQEYQKKLSELGDQKRSLSSQIQYMDTQTNLTELKIQNTEAKVKSLQNEITLLTSRIDGLDESLDQVSKLLIETVVAGYKEKPMTFFDLLLDSNNAGDLIKKVKYYQIAQDNNQKILVHVQEAKLNFEEQKSLREKKKVELDALEKQLIQQKEELTVQKSEKQALLADTQSDEKKYQQLLQQALAEFSAVQKALVSGSKVGPVKKGEPIALVGNSGAPYCSTGAHLHFEVRINNSWVNAENYLATKNVQNNQDGAPIGSGSWDWPLADPIVVEQRYGKTPWSWRYGYSGGIHTGIDMWSHSGEIIRAPADGVLYSSSEPCGAATINIKYIDHGNNLMSFYLHVQ